MTFEEMTRGIAEFVRDHEVWAVPVVFTLAFAESLAFLSLVIPAWGALVSIGALVGMSGINFWPILLAGGFGAACGDWLSYWIGLKFHNRIGSIWPMSSFPEMLPRAERFMRKWGVLGIFIGRFSGPLRATVPLVAGIVEMPYWHFQFANFSSAFLWAAVLMAPGVFGVRMLM
jgi:membrane protein DedA with SNARE-associated domain